MNYNIKEIEKYIVLEHPSLIKGYMGTWIFLISFFGVIMAVCDPFTSYLFVTMISIIIIIDLFGLLILLNAQKWQKLYILYVGIYCVAISAVFYLSFFKITYYILNITSPLLYVVSICIYIFILIISIILLLKALKKEYFSSESSEKSRGGGIIAGISVVGVLVGRVLIGTAKYQTYMIILALIFLFLSYIMILGTHNIYKYYLIKKYESFVKVHKINKKK